MRITVATAVACLLAGISIADETHAAIKEDTIIPAQGLGPALKQLAADRDVQLVYRSELVGDKQTSGAVGELTFDQALTRLLTGTGLTYQYLDDRAVTIVPMDSHVIPAKAGTQSDTQGLWQRFRLAQAETTAAPSQGGRQATSEELSQRGALEEIIVTAQKRAENLRDVPISIAVVTADDINRRGLVNAEDYLRGIPGVNQVDSPYGQTIVFRGIETQPRAHNFRTGATVATYFGESPTTTTAGIGGGSNVDIKLIDIERVEVLRGPQGTAFGNSSLGGAVRTIPVAPKLDHFEGQVAASYSVTSGTGGDNYNAYALGNIPLIADKFAIRAVLYQYDDSGYYRNRAGSDAAFRAISVTPYGAEAFALDGDEAGSYYTRGGRAAALFQATDDLQFTVSYLAQKTETDGFAVASSGTYDQSMLQVAPEHVIRGQKDGIFDTDIDLANATMEYNVGWGNLVTTYSYVKSGSEFATPFTVLGPNSPPISYHGPSDHRQHSGEIRLTTQLDGPWNFLTGLYAEELKDEGTTDYFWYGDPATNPIPGFAGQRALGQYGPDIRNLKQRAAFGEASWEFLQGLTLTGGVRAYEYDRTFDRVTSGPIAGNSSTHEDLKTSDESFRVNLSYKPNDAALLYTGWTQGFRLGQPQGGLPPSRCDLDADGIVDGSNITMDSTTQVQSDSVDSYELGGKFALLDRRLAIDAAVYRLEWSDVPVFSLAPPPCGIGYLTNAGEALSEGVEFQAKYQIAEPLRIDVGGSYTDAHLTKDVPLQGFHAGDRLPGAPRVNANLSAQYEFKIGGHAAFVRADSIYIGPFYGTVQQRANLRAGDYVKLDASARVEIRNLNIDVFVDNLTNEDAFTFRSTVDAGPLYGYRLRPRTIGFRLGYSF